MRLLKKTLKKNPKKITKNNFYKNLDKIYKYVRIKTHYFSWLKTACAVMLVQFLKRGVRDSYFFSDLIVKDFTMFLS